MALSDQSIVTVEQAKNYLGISAANSSKDTLLETWIDVVSRAFESAIDNVVQPATKTVYRDGDGSEFLFLPYYPIITVTTLQERDSPLGSWTDLLSDTSYLHIDTTYYDRLELLEGYTFPEGQKNIKVVYAAGWSTIPGDITKVILEQVSYMWKESGQGADRLSLSGTSSSEAGGSSSYSFTDMSPRWNEVVRRYGKQQNVKVHVIEVFR